MADSKIIEEVFKAIDIITDKKIYLTEYVYTEDCVIVTKTNDSSVYKVLHQGQEFDAYAPLGEVYNNGQSVVVLFTDYSRITKKIILYGRASSSDSIKTLAETRVLNNLRVKSQFYLYNGVSYGSIDPYLVFEPEASTTENFTEIYAYPAISIINPFTKAYQNVITFASSLYSDSSFIETKFPRGDVKIITSKSNPIYYNERGISMPSYTYSPGLRVSAPYATPLALGTAYQAYLTDYYFNSYWIGSIYTDGNALLWYSVSDYRLKENVAPLNSKNSLDRINKLNPVSFNWKKDGSLSEGFIAHEFQEVFPAAVDGAKDDIKSDGSARYQAIDSTKVIPILVSAVQDLSAEIEQLKIEIKKLRESAP